MNEQTFEESIYDLNKLDQQSKFEDDVQTESAYKKNNDDKDETESIYSNQTGISQVSAVTYATEMLGITNDTNFLLLDLRDADEY